MSVEGTSLLRPSVGAGTVLTSTTAYESGQPRCKDKREKLLFLIGAVISTTGMGGIGGGKITTTTSNSAWHRGTPS